MIDERVFTEAAQMQLAGLYRLSLSILASAADAQDAVQQGMLRAWERRGQVSDESRLRAWLMRIVINECRNIQRRRMRVFPVAELPRGAQESGEIADGGLKEAIDALDEKLRTPLLLRYMEGFSEREIAQTLSVPVTTVKNRLFRARKALRAGLEDAEVRFL
ncbi:MAG: sigma-70 family RNA polymerase sigma factor [Clostridia bacterium]|nr:sigma-70 family RNA polymerase sigma factor [Clostridia bacterium]